MYVYEARPVLATKNEPQARNMRERVQQSESSFDLCPSIDGPPAGMTALQFQEQYGGIGGEVTRKLFEEIRTRISSCKLFQEDN